jgi:hypothetical protein
MNSNRTITAQFEQTLKPVTITPTDQWVPHGGSTTIEWEGGSSDATCELFEDGSRIESGLSTPSSITVGPITEVTDYRLECTDGVNGVEDTVRIYVLPKYGEF